MKPLVSIITPMFNSEDFISETINSVISQTYTNWELFLIDDCSTDKTLQIVNQFVSQYPNIKLLKNDTNLGAAITRNKGIEVSQGKYIAFLDADDLWKPQKLQHQIAFMETQNCDVSFSSYEQMNETGKPLNKLIKALRELTYQKYLKSNYIGNLTGMYNVEVLGKIMVPNLRKRQDWAMWLMAIKKSGKPAKGIQESLAVYRVRKDSMSSNKINLIKYNYWVYRKGLGFSTLKSVFYMLGFLYEHFFVKSKLVIKV
ncbi:glycosyltransferase family 2 protein [Mariniflexile soesokkakense]|uniref:Glycosyltransferase family 2 protein n=1 Tax=Mariniflexile soesokkakense TaxID=1343160 RepID=A0ABV0A9P9_9FLAO